MGSVKIKIFSLFSAFTAPSSRPLTLSYLTMRREPEAMDGKWRGQLDGGRGDGCVTPGAGECATCVGIQRGREEDEADGRF